jgi:dihydropteroate synthase
MLLKHFLRSELIDSSEHFLVRDREYVLYADDCAEEEMFFLIEVGKPFLTILDDCNIRFLERLHFNGKNRGLIMFGSILDWKNVVSALLSTRKHDIISFINPILKMIYNRNLLPISLPSGKTLSFDKPLIMGILNRTDDSFYSGSRIADEKRALEIALRMEEDGASIIDIGGESSRPGSDVVSEEEEEKRIIPTIRLLAKHLRIPISVDTRKYGIAKKAIEAGADIINDISGLTADPELFRFVSTEKIPLVLMHCQGNPKTMQLNPFYNDTLLDVKAFFSSMLEKLYAARYPRHHAIIDPGFGFGKTLSDNLILLRSLSDFRDFELPTMIGTSRKSFIGELTKVKKPEERLSGSLATTVSGVSRRVNLFRVHDVKENVQVAEMAFYMMDFLCEGENERGVRSETC